ncbi:hypothetical protein [Bacillus alveayuensis]|uniref:hypothetical protein n=1 Tax=Aeribacillus alveayuensis TaxID=279215 RepID=UPI001364C40F|nr:hypothetical protein [Bacillus alveayuensis]
MKLLLYIIIGMAIAYGLVVALSDFGLILLGGGAFGLLLYIAVNANKNLSR